MVCKTTPAQARCHCKATSQQQDFCNDVVVWQRHRNASEEGLQVVWQLAATPITLPGWDQGHKYASMEIDIYAAAHQVQLGVLSFEGTL